MQDPCKKCSVAHIEKQCPKIENVEQWEDYTREKNLCVRCGVKGCDNAECPRLLVNRFAVQGLAEHTWCGICEEGKIHTLKKCKSTRLCVICKKEDHAAKNCKAWCISCYKKGHSSAQCGTICGDYTDLRSNRPVDADYPGSQCRNCAIPIGQKDRKVDHKYRFCEQDPHCYLCDNYEYKGPKLRPHGAIDCPKRCYICEETHDPKKCPKAAWCSLCADEQIIDKKHCGKYCKKFRTIHCSLCNYHEKFDAGHVAKNCPYYIRFCFLCMGDGYEETGHVARTCPFYDPVGKKIKPVNPRTKRFCFLCYRNGYKETGHVAKYCPYYVLVEGK